MAHATPASDTTAPRSMKRGGADNLLILLFALIALVAYMGAGVPIFLGILTAVL